MKLPEWAQREENYNPGRDRDYFIPAPSCV